jgi:uncharacterized protein
VLLILAATCFLQLPLLARAWSADEGYWWGMAPPLFADDTTKAVLIRGSFLDVMRVNVPHGLILDWSFNAETGRITQILGLFLVGLVLGRIGFFEKPEHFARARRLVLAVATIAATLLWRKGGAMLGAIAAPESPAHMHLQWAFDCWTSLAILTVQLLCFIEAYQTSARRLIRWLAAPGRMTLTLYVGQSLVFVPIFYGFGLGLYGSLSLLQCLWLGLVSFAAQALFAAWWFGRFYYGPLEWIWRVATRMTFDIPLRRYPTGSEAGAVRPARSKIEATTAD